jgi:NTE family protein
LALGGGVAKGWAHIGVLRAFEEAKIPVSMIAGTSIGALVGGCYLAGKLDALEEFARSLTWTSVLRFMDFTLTGAGLISGMRLAARMAEHLDGATIESLPAPFVSVCTDIRSGHEIWLHDGPMIAAIRASYALPGVFAPVEHNGRMLVDGALVNPVPVSACRAYEPDIVIAVNLNSEAFGRNTIIRSSHYDNPIVRRPEQTSAWSAFLSAVDHHGGAEPEGGTQARRGGRASGRLGLSGVMIEAFTIIQDRIERARLAGDPPDFVIRPRLAKIGLSEFHRASESIDVGYAEARKRIGELVDSGLLETIRQAS